MKGNLSFLDKLFKATNLVYADKNNYSTKESKKAWKTRLKFHEASG